MNTEIGTSSYAANEFKKRTNMANANWGLKEGSNVYRVLPPFGSMAASGFWSKFEMVHWGYVLSNGKQRPFRCIQDQDFKTKRINVHCPQCDKIAAMAKQEEAARDSYKDEGLSKELIKKNLTPFTDWAKRFNTERKHFLNVLRPDGQIGRLKLSNKAMRCLRAEIKRLRDSKEHVDPCGIESGVDFDFYRTGMDTNSEYKVMPVYQSMTVTGPGGVPMQANILKSSPLTAELLERYKTEGFDMGAFYKDLTRDEIQILVESGADPATVDSIFGMPKVQATPAAVEYEDSSEESEETAILNPVLAAAVASVVESSSSSVDAEEAELQKQLAALRAKKATSSVSNSDDWMNAYKTNKL